MILKKMINDNEFLFLEDTHYFLTYSKRRLILNFI